ncbi:MAG: hypothetical protein ABW095_09155, partial [Candidatus Thiodiazotropha sp.]
MKKIMLCAIAGMGLMNALVVQAAPEPKDPKLQTPWHLYVDAKEAYDMKQEKGAEVLFVDVRDPIEIMFTGFTDSVDINIPFKLANRAAWNPKKPVYQQASLRSHERFWDIQVHQNRFDL